MPGISSFLQVHANDQGSDMSGYMKVWKVKKWKKFWFVVKDKVLYKYRASEVRAIPVSFSLRSLFGAEFPRRGSQNEREGSSTKIRIDHFKISVENRLFQDSAAMDSRPLLGYVVEVYTNVSPRLID